MSEKTNEQLTEEIEMLKKIVETLQNKVEAQQKTGHIYALIHRRYGTIDYVGHHIGSDIGDRLQSHIGDLMHLVKVPFYKLMIQQALRKQYK